MNNNLPTFMGFKRDYNEADIVVFGAPFDSTTSYRPGTRFASAHMRLESIGFETYSPYQDKALEEINVVDGGDLIMNIGSAEVSLNIIEEYTDRILEDGKIPFMLGGEHLVTLGTVRSVFKKYPDVHVLHFDAHTDLRDVFFGEKLSHANVMRRIWDFVGDNKIYQFGIRSGERAEFEWAKSHTHLQKYNLDGLDEVLEYLKDKPVYLSIDLDVLDPSVFPGTGTPEPGGITFMELLNAILKMNKLNIVGADLNELAPHYDPSGASTAVAVKTLRETLLMIGTNLKK